MQTQMGLGFKAGTLANGTPFVETMNGAPLPATITLESTAGGRAIEFSPDGVSWFTPTYSINVTAMLVAVADATIAAVRFTGATGNTYDIR